MNPRKGAKDELMVERKLIKSTPNASVEVVSHSLSTSNGLGSHRPLLRSKRFHGNTAPKNCSLPTRNSCCTSAGYPNSLIRSSCHLRKSASCSRDHFVTLPLFRFFTLNSESSVISLPDLCLRECSSLVVGLSMIFQTFVLQR